MKRTDKTAHNDQTQKPQAPAAKKPAPLTFAGLMGSPKAASKFVKPALTVKQKREQEMLGHSHAEMKSQEQALLTLSQLSIFDAAQESMFFQRMAQMMHKIGHVRLPHLRASFQARSSRILGRQQPKISNRVMERKKGKPAYILRRFQPQMPF